jgi:ribA/ribD-fused uncharacterized protein
MNDILSITTVKAPHGWLGNMAPFPLWHGGKRWRTSEALFQAMRFDDEAIEEEIREKKSPMAAKFVAKREKAKMTVVPQSDRDLDQIEHVLWLKLEQHPELKERLLETGDRPIIEDCTRRQHGSGLFWGAAWKDGRWVGENRLGKLWMKLRAELRAGRAAAFASPATAFGRVAC